MVQKRQRPILDIRCLESRHRYLGGQTYAHADWGWVADRIARKLRELGFVLAEGADHLGVLFTPDAIGGVEVQPRIGREVVALLTVAPEALDPSDGGARAIAAAIFRALRAIAIDRPDDLASIDRVERDLEELGRDLEVVYFRHETRAYRVVIAHRLAPMVAGTLKPVRPARRYQAVLSYEDLASGESLRGVFLLFDTYEILHGAIGSVTIQDGKLIVRPKRGDHYGVALEVPLEQLRAGTFEPIKS
jgi:hypothetical protein